MGQAVSRQEEFWEACSFGRTWLVEKMIADGDIDVNWVSHVHNCAPIHVSSQGRADIVKLLIAANCKIDLRDIKDNTALHHAAMSGNAEICEVLLAAGADSSAANSAGWTPLINAAYWNNLEALRVLLEHQFVVLLPPQPSPSSPTATTINSDEWARNKDGRNALHELCRSKCVSEPPQRTAASLLAGFEELVKCGAPLHQKSSNRAAHAEWGGIGGGGGGGGAVGCCEADFTPMLYACYHGHELLVRRCVELGADLELTDHNGWTALHWTAQRGNLQLVKYLVEEAKARREPVCLRGKTPSDVATTRKIQNYLLGLEDECEEDESEEGEEEEKEEYDIPNGSATENEIISYNGYVTTDTEEEDESESHRRATPQNEENCEAEMKQRKNEEDEREEAKEKEEQSHGDILTEN